MNSEILKAFSKDDLLALIQVQLVQAEAQAAQIGALTARIAELEARLGAPRKTPGNSGTPPSKGHKPNRPERPKTPRRGRPGVTRALAAHPDRTIEATLDACPCCGHALGLADQPDVHAYDRDDLFRFVTRRDVPYTNNACERALRPSVIFRKVTGGFRAEWGARVYAAAVSITATGRLHGLTAFGALRAALAGKAVMQTA